MPSTTSSSSCRPLPSSTVITPSLPTFSMALAISSPMVSSELAEIEATWVISLLVEQGLEILSNSVTAAATALSMPRLRSIGFMPAVTNFIPSRTILWASTVAVVVPSPALSAVFEATSLTICAPMFCSLSSNSISLATVTPSLVITGDPKDFWITTLRPFGPSVTLTALAKILTPSTNFARLLSPKVTCFAVISLSPYSTIAITSSSLRIRCSSLSILTFCPAYCEYITVSPSLTTKGTTCPSSVIFPEPTPITLPVTGFSLAASGITIPDFVTVSASNGLIRIRSLIGFIFIHFSLLSKNPGRVSPHKYDTATLESYYFFSVNSASTISSCC